MTNLLLEQYARYKKTALERSPYSCLLNADIQLNPHQINAFCAALQALKTGGIILADEVGLGKTIEAGLVLKYVIQSGAKRVLIALPATLRKQWEVELDEKLGIRATILDRFLVEKDYHATKVICVDQSKTLITSANLSYHGQEGNIEMGTYIESATIARQVDEVFTKLLFSKVFLEYM